MEKITLVSGLKEINMSQNNKVIWTEGMFLRPQHFQQQDRNFQSWIETRCSGLQIYSWGLTILELDQQMLAPHTKDHPFLGLTTDHFTAYT